jgi:hypothetical protein
MPESYYRKIILSRRELRRKKGGTKGTDFDDSNDNQPRGGRAREHGTGTRAGNLDSAERYSLALYGRGCTVFDDRCRIVIDNLECRGLEAVSVVRFRP